MFLPLWVPGSVAVVFTKMEHNSSRRISFLDWPLKFISLLIKTSIIGQERISTWDSNFWRGGLVNQPHHRQILVKDIHLDLFGLLWPRSVNWQEKYTWLDEEELGGRKWLWHRVWNLVLNQPITPSEERHPTQLLYGATFQDIFYHTRLTLFLICGSLVNNILHFLIMIWLCIPPRLTIHLQF